MFRELCGQQHFDSADINKSSDEVSAYLAFSTPGMKPYVMVGTLCL